MVKSTEERLLMDVAMLLALQAEGQISQEEFEQWRERWLKEYTRTLADWGKTE